MVDVEPAPPVFPLAWLSPASVKAWLRLDVDDTADDADIVQCCADTEVYVETVRPDRRTVATDPDTGLPVPGPYVPDAEVYQGAVMYAARLFRRRNSPAGVELFGDQASFVSRYDADIDRALRTGPWQPSVAV
jgi:hypothetical protein